MAKRSKREKSFLSSRTSQELVLRRKALFVRVVYIGDISLRLNGLGWPKAHGPNLLAHILIKLASKKIKKNVFDNFYYVVVLVHKR